MLDVSNNVASTYELYSLGESTGVIIEANNKDEGWEKVKRMGFANRAKKLELVEL